MWLGLLSVVSFTGGLLSPRRLASSTQDAGISSVSSQYRPPTPSVFKLNQGRAIDTLRQDYPCLWTHAPDLSIFTDDVEFHDATGKKRVAGIQRYERLFDTMRFVRRTFVADSQVSYRLVVTGESIRVRWTAKLYMRDPILGKRTFFQNASTVLFHLDGISSYHLDAKGKIDRHTLETLQYHDPGEASLLPVVLVSGIAWPLLVQSPPVLLDPRLAYGGGGGGCLPSATTTPVKAMRTPQPPVSLEGETPMQRAARERAEDKDAQFKKMYQRENHQERMWWQRFLPSWSMPQQCETSFDCEPPEVCCDLLVARVCCDGGMLIPSVPQVQLQAIPIPVDDEPFLPGP